MPTLDDSNVAHPPQVAQGGSSSLEPRPLLRPRGWAWHLRLIPQAGEATLTYANADRGTPRRRDWQLAPEPAAGPTVSHGTRAKGKVRRYVRANRERFLWTLTYREEPTGRKQVVKDLRHFFDRVHVKLGRMPLIAVIERGGRNGRLHVHFAAPKFLKHKVVEQLWGRGFVWVGDPGQLPGRVPTRRLAAYLAKYVSKQLDQAEDGAPEERAKGEHRYLVTQGFQPTVWRLTFRTFDRANECLAMLYGEAEDAIPWGDSQADPVWGWWFCYGDSLLHPRPGLVS